ncbi:hypothetical protein ACSBR2_027019 [Camellia fascicularis]
MNITGEDESVVYHHGNMKEDNDVACTEAKVEANDNMAINKKGKARMEGLDEKHAHMSTLVSMVNETGTGLAA